MPERPSTARAPDRATSMPSGPDAPQQRPAPLARDDFEAAHLGARDARVEIQHPLRALDAGREDIALGSRGEMRHQPLVDAHGDARRHACYQRADRALLWSERPLADTEIVHGAGS